MSVGVPYAKKLEISTQSLDFPSTVNEISGQ